MGSGSRDMHETCREIQTNAGLMLVEDTPRYQHPELWIGIYSIAAFFGHVRQGMAGACAASACTRLTAAPKGAVQAMVAGSICSSPGVAMAIWGCLIPFSGMAVS